MGKEYKQITVIIRQSEPPAKLPRYFLTGNYGSFFLFHRAFVVSFSVCGSTLFKATFEVPLCKKTILDWKRNKKHCIFFKISFSNALF